MGTMTRVLSEMSENPISYCATFYIALVLLAVKDVIRRIVVSLKEKYQNAKWKRHMGQACFQKQACVQEL